jgi:protein-S-isoprenylcysteine O-methyltransferase Ste14
LNIRLHKVNMSNKGEALLASVIGSRTHDRSLAVKAIWIAAHYAAVHLAVWLVPLGGASRTLGLENRAPLRSSLCVNAAVLYWVTNMFRLIVTLQRRVSYAEALPLTAFSVVWTVGSSLLAMGVCWPHAGDCAPVDYAAAMLVVLACVLSTAAELQRHMWKARPENRGHCYTGGLWAFSMHINYFADILLFSGWTCLTGTWWLCWLPIGMAYNFAFNQIPELDAYLERRYCDEFREWRSRKHSKKLIPFVW